MAVDGEVADQPVAIEVDRLLEAARVEPDEAKRKELFFEFQKIIADEVPAINTVARRHRSPAASSSTTAPALSSARRR